MSGTRAGNGGSYQTQLKAYTMQRTTLLLADDHAIFRQGLRMLLNTQSDIDVIGEAETGREAVLLTKQMSPMMVIMDIGMPHLNGMEAARQIFQFSPLTKILILSGHCEDEYIEQMLMIRVHGYLTKQTSADILFEAIRAINNGKRFYSPFISQRIREQYQKTQIRNRLQKKRSVKLSSREMEVLQLIAEGKANKEVAAELEISIKTVEKHRQHLMEKLNIHDIANLTRYAIASGIIENNTFLADVLS
jgi:DNA-binding NarL/FixJ family response regulator